MFKIKVKPEDFIVEEVADIPISSGGNFCVYLLKKSGWNTIDVLKRLSKKLSIPYSNFSYGGRKDKYALTSQYITIALEKISNKEIFEDNYSLSFVGLMERPMGPDLIKGNRFHISIRNLVKEDLKSAISEIEHVKKEGYPNYFDDQRFGSYDSRQGFIAEKIFKKHYNGALKIYFTRFHPADSKMEKEHKKFLNENWGNWQVCLEEATNKFENETFKYLLRHPKGFVPILQKIPHEEMSLFFSAYQSYLWNEILRKTVGKICKGTLKVSKGIVGDYLFYKQWDDADGNYLKRLIIPTPASNAQMPDTLTENLYKEILDDKNLKLSMFNTRKIRQVYFKSTERSAIVIPEELSIDCAEDEIYTGKEKATLKFFLPRGCFGTMLIKRLFD